MHYPHPSHSFPLRHLFTWQRFIMLALLATIAFGAPSCKAKKEARAAAAAKAEKVAKARADLLAVINDQGSMTTDEKEEIVDNIKAMNLQDGEIQNLISRAEDIIAEERAAARTEAENALPAPTEGTTDAKVQNAFSDIARSGSESDANFKIREALGMFASPQTPVLIIISETGGQKDYDEPTTIQKYLNYLKDTKNEPADIYNLEYDANGKIKEVELKKNY